MPDKIEKPDKVTKIEKALLKQYKKEEDSNTVYTSFFETENSILEQIRPIKNKIADGADGAYSFSDTKFILYDKVTASIDYLDHLEYHGKVYKPIDDKILSSGVLALPSGIEEYGETSDLVNEIHDFLYRNFQVPTFWEDFLPYVVLFYWVYEKFPFVPYIHFVGLTGTGKTTAQEVMGSICYKPMNVSGSITLSPIFRTSSLWHGTLLLDEFEPDGEGYREMLSLLKSGVGNTAVLRTEGDSKREVNVYLIKSPKMFTSERPISNAGLRSRTFLIQMEKNKRRVPVFRLEKFSEEAQLLRNKLLLWRLRNFSKINLNDIEYGFDELAWLDGRVQQVITPIYYLSDEDTRKKIVEFAKIQETETKQERADSLEGKIFQIIVNSYPMNVAIKFIADEINKDSGKRPITPEKISGIVRKVLQFDIEIYGHEKTRMVMASSKPERVTDLCSYFGISVSAEPSAPSAPSANGETKREGETETLDDFNDINESVKL